MASLHLGHLDSPRHHIHYGVAARHRSLALKAAIPALQHINSTNSHALFALSSLVAIMELILPQKPSPGTIHTPTDEFMNVTMLVRGAQTVAQGGLQWIDQGDLSPLLYPGSLKKSAQSTAEIDGQPSTEDKSHLPATLSSSVESALKELNSLNSTRTADAESRSSYAAAILFLRRTFETISFIKTESVLAFEWVVFVQEPYIDRLKRKEPMALVILAHYGVLMHHVTGQ